MKNREESLLSTGFYTDTFTVAGDPLLSFKERDNGVDWQLRAYIGDKLIEVLDLLVLSSFKVHESLLNLPVTKEGKYVGTVRYLLARARELDKLEKEQMKEYLESL